jgi:regulatory protein SWI6
MPNGKAPEVKTRFATKPIMPRGDRSAPLKDHRRTPIVSAILQRDDPDTVMDLLREVPVDDPALPLSVDVVLDELGHTALHIAASMSRMRIVDALVAAGADVHRGNYNGETALIRAALMTNNFDAQTFGALVGVLHASVRTIDTARKSVLHHVIAFAGVRNRAIVAGYYLEQIFMWVAEHEGGDFKSLVDLQDEHGDTALNIAARVGNRSLVRSLIDVGADRGLPNKLGLRPGDFGVENEVRGDALRARRLRLTGSRNSVADHASRICSRRCAQAGQPSPRSARRTCSRT